MFGADYEVYQYLESVKDDDLVLKEFNLEYPSEKISVASNTIFIGLSEAKPTQRTHQSQKYNELVDIVISTKQSNYSEAMKIFRVVAGKLMKILRDSKEFSDRFNVISFIPKYLSEELKYGELLVSITSLETFNPVDEADLDVEIVNTLIRES